VNEICISFKSDRLCNSKYKAKKGTHGGMLVGFIPRKKVTPELRKYRGVALNKMISQKV